jgi:hypothetical protein
LSDDRNPPQGDEEPNRTLTNVVMLVFFVLVVGIGVWIVNVMLDQRKLQDCVSAGRRNCAPIDVPINER